MPRIQRSIVVAAVAFLAAVPAAFAAASLPLADAAACRQVTLAEAPGWISSVVWSESRSGVVVADPRHRVLRLYGADGSAERLGDPRPDKTGAFRPGRISAAGDGFLLKLTGGEVVRLGADLRPRAALDLRSTAGGTPSGLGSLYEWVVVGDHLVGYGSVRGAAADLVEAAEPARRFQLGLLSAELEGPGRARLLLPLEEDDYYVLGHSYVAANDLGAFFLAMGTRPRIYRVSLEGTGEARPLAAMPAAWREIEALGMESTGPESSRALFAEVESRAMPAGLYGQEERLYLLAREPAAGEGTAWSLHQIDPASDEVLGAIRLPTTASHLTLVPGPDAWYVFEKGPVEAWGEQRIETLLVIPRAWIERPSESPLALAAPAVRRCARR